MSVEVPSPFNPFDAYQALYDYANPTPRHKMNALRLFKFYCPDQRCTGPVEVNFTRFPALDVTLYEEKYGIGAARLAFDSYIRAPHSQFPSQNDLKIAPCSLFTEMFRRQLSIEGAHETLAEVTPLIERCSALEKSEGRIHTKTYPPKNRLYPFCNAKYELSERVATLGIDPAQNSTCKVAIETLAKLSLHLLRSGPPERLYVTQITVCQHNNRFPFRCEEEGPATIDAALKMVREMDRAKR